MVARLTGPPAPPRYLRLQGWGMTAPQGLPHALVLTVVDTHDGTHISALVDGADVLQQEHGYFWHELERMFTPGPSPRLQRARDEALRMWQGPAGAALQRYNEALYAAATVTQVREIVARALNPWSFDGTAFDSGPGPALKAFDAAVAQEPADPRHHEPQPVMDASMRREWPMHDNRQRALEHDWRGHLGRAEAR